MKSIKLYCNNGVFLSDVEHTFKTLYPCFDIGTVHDHLPIPEGVTFKAKNVIQNLYGTFVQAEYNGMMYEVVPKYLEVVDG